MSIDYKKWLEIFNLYLTGALAKITNEVWEVESERSGHDFGFTCRLGDFVKGTRSYDFTYPQLYEQLLLDALNIAHLCEREGGKIEVPIQNFYLLSIIDHER